VESIGPLSKVVSEQSFISHDLCWSSIPWVVTAPAKGGRFFTLAGFVWAKSFGRYFAGYEIFRMNFSI